MPVRPTWLARLSRRARRDSPQSPREESLEEAADRLGVQLGEYYPDDPQTQPGEATPGMDDPEASSRVDASREELLAYIATSRSKRRRGRMRLLQTAGVGGAVATAAIVVAASGVLDGPPSGGEAPKAPTHWTQEITRPLHSGAGVPRLAPEVLIELPADRAHAVASAYVDLRGDICTSIAFSEGGVTGRQAGIDCRPGPRIARAIRHRGAGFALSVESGAGLLASGYARPDLERIVIAGPQMGVDRTISGVWDSTDGLRLKVFLVRLVDERSPARLIGVFRGGDRRPITDLPGARSPRSTSTR
jgi:hypothetical protein